MSLTYLWYWRKNLETRMVSVNQKSFLQYGNAPWLDVSFFYIWVYKFHSLKFSSKHFLSPPSYFRAFCVTFLEFKWCVSSMMTKIYNFFPLSIDLFCFYYITYGDDRLYHSLWGTYCCSSPLLPDQKKKCEKCPLLLFLIKTTILNNSNILRTSCWFVSKGTC